MSEIEAFLPKRSREYYHRKASIYAKIIEKTYGLTIDDVTFNRWTELAMLIRTADNLTDDTSREESAAQKNQSLMALVTSGAFDEFYPSLTRSSLGDDTFMSFMAIAKVLLKENEHGKSADSIDQLIAHRTTEGFLTALMILELAHESLQRQPRFSRFAEHLGYAGITSTIGNSMLDHYKDCHAELSLPYRTKNHIALIGAYAKWTVRSLRSFLPAARVRGSAPQVSSHHARHAADHPASS